MELFSRSPVAQRVLHASAEFRRKWYEAVDWLKEELDRVSELGPGSSRHVDMEDALGHRRAGVDWCRPCASGDKGYHTGTGAATGG